MRAGPEGRRKSGNRHRDSTDLRVKRSAASDTFRRRSPSRLVAGASERSGRESDGGDHLLRDTPSLGLPAPLDCRATPQPVCDRRAPVVVFRARRRARLSVRTAGFLSSDFTRTLRLLTSRVVVLVNPLVRARTAVCPKARPLTVCFHCSCEVCVRRYRTNNHTSHLRNKG